MRKRKKEKILSLLESMKEAYTVILSFLQEKKTGEVFSLLSICQDGMEKCGKEVELQEERGEEYTVLFLSYLERIFRGYEAIQENNWKRSREIFNFNLNFSFIYFFRISDKKSCFCHFK